MKRFLSAAFFFVVLLVLWQEFFCAKIWSPLLLPSPLQVANYLKGAIDDRTLGHSTVITMGLKVCHIWLTVIILGSRHFIGRWMKQVWAFAGRSLMAAEIFVTILTGLVLGQLVHNGRELRAMDQVIAMMLVMVVIGLLAD